MLWSNLHWFIYTQILSFYLIYYFIKGRFNIQGTFKSRPFRFFSRLLWLFSTFILSFIWNIIDTAFCFFSLIYNLKRLFSKFFFLCKRHIRCGRFMYFMNNIRVNFMMTYTGIRELHPEPSFIIIMFNIIFFFYISVLF